jgi:hypothetical protein
VKAATIGIRTLADYSVWLKDRKQWDNLLSDGQFLLHGTCSGEVCLAFGPYHSLDLRSHIWFGWGLF